MNKFFVLPLITAPLALVALMAVAVDRELPFSVNDVNWKTNFKNHSIDLNEILSGGPPRDGIPSIDKPVFVSFSRADKWLKAKEPVVALALGSEAKAYPLQVLIWHEIVNDEIGGSPVAVTFCPLCNSAIAFHRVLDGVVYDFGTTGRLRHSDLVMYDRQTESWWQQLTGEAIIGDLTGKRLKMMPASIISYSDFKEAYPGGKILSRDTGYVRSYGSNPYVGYDRVGQVPFLFKGPVDGRLPPMERVVTVTMGGVDRAYPYGLLSKAGVVNDVVAGHKIAVFYKAGTLSALDAPFISDSRDVGSTGVFFSEIDGRTLTFISLGGAISDKETGSAWDILGRATSGPMKGKALRPVVHGDYFAFAWFAFKPKTVIYKE